MFISCTIKFQFLFQWLFYYLVEVHKTNLDLTHCRLYILTVDVIGTSQAGVWEPRTVFGCRLQLSKFKKKYCWSTCWSPHPPVNPVGSEICHGIGVAGATHVLKSTQSPSFKHCRHNMYVPKVSNILILPSSIIMFNTVNTELNCDNVSRFFCLVFWIFQLMKYFKIHLCSIINSLCGKRYFRM